MTCFCPNTLCTLNQSKASFHSIQLCSLIRLQLITHINFNIDNTEKRLSQLNRKDLK